MCFPISYLVVHKMLTSISHPLFWKHSISWFYSSSLGYFTKTLFLCQMYIWFLNLAKNTFRFWNHGKLQTTDTYANSCSIWFLDISIFKYKWVLWLTWLSPDCIFLNIFQRLKTSLKLVQWHSDRLKQQTDTGTLFVKKLSFNFSMLLAVC